MEKPTIMALAPVPATPRVATLTSWVEGETATGLTVSVTVLLFTVSSGVEAEKK